MLEFRLLGPLEVRDGERVVDLRRRKHRALLAALALRPGEPVSADRLVDELWGESPPKTARHALENYVSELRKSLGRDVIGTGPAGYVLDVEPDRVDVTRFERLLAEARDAAPDQRAEKLRSALALVRGEPLGDLAFEPFAGTAVARLQELELGAREELAQTELELGRHADVVATLEPLVAAHPYRERLRALLMLALYRSGRQADALAAYQSARSVLVEELGIDPGEELQELERAILRQDASLRAPAPMPAPRVTEAPRPRAARKTVSLVLAELANAGELADTLDPEPLRAILDRFRAIASSAAERHGGTAGRLGGDTALALFGVPVTHEDDALRAVRTAHELRAGVGVLNDGLLSEHGVFLELRTAVTTGEVLVTPDSDELATGRALSEAERLERGARPGQIVLDEPTHAAVRDLVEAERTNGAYRLVELRPDVHGRALRLDAALVGRRRQLAALASAFENVVADRAVHLFTLLGAAGVGKSRLVREFAQGNEEVAIVLEGRCLPYGETIALRPLLEALRAAGVDDVVLDAESIRGALERVARERPLVVVVDDLHWGEPALLDVLEHVAESSRGAAILLVCIARPDLLEERPGWGGGKLNASSTLLEPLSEAEAERLMDNLLGESDLPEAVRDYVVRTAEGNPLFLEELLATLVERNILQRQAGRWTTTQVAAIPLPPTVQALIAARIDRLPESERVVLELASVNGRRVFERNLVAELAPEALRPEVDEHLLALVRKELVRPEADESGRFSFRHQLIREGAYSSLPMQVRADLHERFANVVERAAPRSADATELARYHRDQAKRFREILGGV